MNFKQIFHLYFLNMNISLDIALAFTKFPTFIETIHMQESVSQNSFLGLSSDFMTKKAVFHNYPFSTCHKTKSQGLHQEFETHFSSSLCA